MAARKKAKSKRKKAPARRPAAPRKLAKKPAKKPAKRTPVRRAPVKKAKPAVRPAAAKPVAVSPAALPPPGERIGVVTHYFSHLLVAVVKLEAATLRVGDTIHIRGHTTDFKQRVDSLQVNHEYVPEVGPKDDFGLKVREHAREHDVVYLVK
jgi:putative protease